MGRNYILLLYKGFRPIEKSISQSERALTSLLFSYIMQVKFSIHLSKFPIEYRAIVQSCNSLFRTTYFEIRSLGSYLQNY